MEMCSAVRISGIIHLVLQALGDFPFYINSLWQPYCTRCWVALQIRTEGARKCHLHQSAPHRGVKCRASLCNRTLRVQALQNHPSCVYSM